MNKFLLHANGLMAKGLEVLNPIIALVVFLAVVAMGTRMNFGTIGVLITAAAAAILVSGPIAVLTNIRNMLREATTTRE